MRRGELINRLIEAGTAERTLLFAANVGSVDLRLAVEIRNECIAAWASDPARVKKCVVVANRIARINSEKLILANADWTGGIGEIIRGRFESAVTKLERADVAFADSGKDGDAAQTKVAKLLALAMLGRYDDAIQTGLAAIPLMVRLGDELAAGKIEMNLSNIVSRRSDHREAERLCMSARKRFIKTGETKWQAMAENGLANTYAELNDFAKAERFYAMAFATAVTAEMHVTEAEIEASMGNLALFRGRYADALRHLELSRRKFEVLAMPHQTAIADLEIADIYAELNLNAEAIDIYTRVAASFRFLKLRAEEARSLLSLGRALMKIGNAAGARTQLAQAYKLFSIEKNIPGQAASNIANARLALDSGDHVLALSIVRKTENLLATDQNARLPLAIDLIEGEAYLLANNRRKAKICFTKTLIEARRLHQPDAVQKSLNFLGKTALADGNAHAAESYLKKSVRVVESLRAPLASEEFSMSFLAARLEPYDDLVQLYISEERYSDAFRTIESRRSRFLLDAVNSRVVREHAGAFSVELARLRDELNSYYKRLDRSGHEGDTEKLNLAIREREARMSKLTREIASVTIKNAPVQSGATIKRLQKYLGKNRTLIEFVENEGVFSAFVVTGSDVHFVPDLVSIDEVTTELESLQFQFGSLRYGTAGMERFLGQMISRANACLERLFDRLILPLEQLLDGERLVIVPAGLLYYVPFHALYDASRYLVERFETTYAPSASVWINLQKREARKINSSLLIGYADERIPLVEGEIGAIKRFVTNSKTLIGKDATFTGFIKQSEKSDLIHLACHGHFRSDNPMYSSLHLADGWVTVHDICERKISAELVVLSACETGLSKVFAGDEILGLARGFLSAGAAALIVSLWTVNDLATSQLMQDLYLEMQRGQTPAASLRQAQLNSIAKNQHPYRWSPFVLIGR